MGTHAVNYLKRVFYGLAAFALSAAAAAQEAPVPKDAPVAQVSAAEAAQPVAKVGDHEITAEEFARFARFRLRRMSMEMGKAVEPDAKFRVQAMSELMATRILEVLAGEAKVTVTDEEVNKDFENSKTLFKGPEDYQKYLKEQGVTEDELREEVRRKLLIDKFVEEKTKDVVVAPEAVQTEYESLKNKGKMNRDTKTADLVQIVALFVPGDTASEEAAKAKIEGVRERIQKGEKFEDVGAAVSKDPNAGMQMGTIDEAKPASLFPDILKALEQLKPGEMSEALKTPRGYGLVLLKAWNEPGTVPFEKVQARIERELRSLKQREVVGGLIKEARERIPFEIYKAPVEQQGAALAPVPSPAPSGGLSATQ